MKIITTIPKATPEVFFITGNAKAGKSTVAKMLSELTGKAWGDCSDIVYELYSEKTGIPVATLKAMSPEEKERIRPELVAIGNEAADACPPVFIMKNLAMNNNIIAGVRRTIEALVASKQVYHWIWTMPYIIYIDRPGGPKIKDNNEMTSLSADLVIDNAEDRLDLTRGQVEEVVRLWKSA